MHDHRGFIGLPVLLAILLGIVVLGGGAYYVQQQSASKTESSNLDNLQELQADTVASNLTPKPQISSPSSTAENNAKWTTYRNGKFSFELQYPSDMTVREQTGSDPRTGENWVRVMFRNEQDDFGLTFFAGVQFVGGPGEGYSSFQTKSITVAGKQVQEALSAPDSRASDEVLLSIYTSHSDNRYDNFYSTFKRSQMATFVPRIEAIVATLKYTDSTSNSSTLRWDIGSKVDDNFSKATVTLSLPTGIVRTAEINVRNDCKELNQQNLNDEWIKKVNAGAVFDKEPNVINPGLACVSWDTFTWYGVFSENGKYYVKQLADDASGLGNQTWKIIKEI